MKRKTSRAKILLKESRESTGSIQKSPSLRWGITTSIKSNGKVKRPFGATERPGTDPSRKTLNLTTYSGKGSNKLSKDPIECQVPEQLFSPTTPRYGGRNNDSLHRQQIESENEAATKLSSKEGEVELSPSGTYYTLGLRTDSSSGTSGESSILFNQPFLKHQHSHIAKKNEPTCTLSPSLKRRELQSDVKVVTRVRPPSQAERAAMEKGVGSIAVDVLNSQTLHFIQEVRDFTLDSVFGPEEPQVKIYETVGLPTINDILAGYNGTIFAYGPTGSGKTFTMFGPEVNDEEFKGIIPRAAYDIFSLWSNQADSRELEVRCSMVELYNEHLKDLLTDCHTEIRIKESPSRGIYVEGLQDFPCSNEKELLHYIQVGSERRRWAETKQNAVSSRSHTIFMIEVLQKMMDGSEKRGLLNLVDLAGSEKVGRTGAQGIQFEEGTKINLSLSALGNVIHALTTNQEHVPYRDSKLTRLLQESLGGNFKTTLITTCSPHSSQIADSLSTLNFAARAKRLRNKVKANIKLSPYQLQQIINNLRQELLEKETEIANMRNLFPTAGSSEDLANIEMVEFETEWTW